MGKSSRRERAAPVTTLAKPPEPNPSASFFTVRAIVPAIVTIALAATPLCLLPGVFLSHDVMPKVIVTLVSAALLLLMLLRLTSGIAKLWREPAAKVFLGLASAQCVSLLISTAGSTQPWLSLSGTVWRRFGAVEQIATLVIAVAAAAFVASEKSLNKSWTRSLVRAMSLGGAMGSAYGICQYFGFDPFLDPAWYKLEFFGGVVRPPATMGHAIYFAAWLVPVVAIAASSSWSETNSGWKSLQITAASLGSIAIFLSGSRGAVLALACAAFLFAIRMHRLAGGRFLRQFGTAVGLLLLIATSLTLSPLGVRIRSRMTQWREDPGGPRLAVWRESRAILQKYPITGAGPETFAAEFRKIESEELSRTYPDFYDETPHNALIDAVCSQGLPGLLILAGIFGLGIGRFPRGQPAEPIAIAGLQAAVFGIFAASLFASFTIVEATTLWSLVGISTALQLTGTTPVRSRTTALWRIPAALVSAVFLILTLALAVPDAAYTGLADAVARNDLSRAVRIFDRASAWRAGSSLPGYELYASRQFAFLARSLAGTPRAAQAWSKASEAAAAAELSSEEGFSAAFQSSLVAISTGDLTRAEIKARKATELAPNWHRPRVFLAQILRATGRNSEAETQERLSLRFGAK